MRKTEILTLLRESADYLSGQELCRLSEEEAALLDRLLDKCVNG